MARSTSDRLAVAMLWGQASYCIAHHTPRAEAVASLREISTRPDLLAEVAGVQAGAADRRGSDWPRRREELRLLLAAGADRGLLPGWAREGRRRALLHGARSADGDSIEAALRDVMDGA